MAKIVAGIGTSHVPAIGAASDHGKDRNEYYKPLFDGYDPAREWIKRVDPDVVILVYNDHASAFSVEVINTFVLGVAEHYGVRAAPKPSIAIRSDQRCWALETLLRLQPPLRQGLVPDGAVSPRARSTGAGADL